MRRRAAIPHPCSNVGSGPQVSVPMAPSLKDPPQGLPIPLLIMVTILGAEWQALALGPTTWVATPYTKTSCLSQVTQAVLTNPLGPLCLVAGGRAGQGWTGGNGEPGRCSGTGHCGLKG